MDGCHRWDAGGHEAGAGGAGVLEWGSGAGGAGGCGKCKCGWVKVSGGGGVSWRVDEGVVNEGGVVDGACDPGHGVDGLRGVVWARLNVRWCVHCGVWWQASVGGV